MGQPGRRVSTSSRRSVAPRRSDVATSKKKAGRREPSGFQVHATNGDSSTIASHAATRKAAAIFDAAHVEALAHIDHDDRMQTNASYVVRIAAEALSGDARARAILDRMCNVALGAARSPHDRAPLIRIVHAAVVQGMGVARDDGAEVSPQERADVVRGLLERDVPSAYSVPPLHELAATFAIARRGARAHTAAIASLVTRTNVDADAVKKALLAK